MEAWRVDGSVNLAQAGWMRTPGETLRDLRHERGLTLDDLARRTGIAKATLSRYENGRQAPSVDVFFALGRGLGVEFVPREAVPDARNKAIALERVCALGMALPRKRRPDVLEYPPFSTLGS